MPPPQTPYNAYESAAIFFPIPQVNMSLHTTGTTSVTTTGTLVYDPRGPFNVPDGPPHYAPFEGYGPYQGHLW